MGERISAVHYVRGCIDCPFAAELFAACEHPRSTKANSRAVSGLYDGQLARGAKPATCPLRERPITITLAPNVKRRRDERGEP